MAANRHRIGRQPFLFPLQALHRKGKTLIFQKAADGGFEVIFDHPVVFT